MLRKTVKGIWYIAGKLYKTASDHLILSGTEKFCLPNNNSFKIFSRGDDFIPNQVFWKGYKGYEESIEVFYYFSLHSKTIIDIGANIGYFSLVAASANPESVIYAFEPVDRIFQRFEKQIKINNFKNIQNEKIAVSDHDGEIIFYIPKGDAMDLASSAKKGWVSKVNEELLECITLDSYSISKKTGKIDLVKIDCEFHEYEILQGMVKILENDGPAILMEVLMPQAGKLIDNFVDGGFLKIESLMKKLGYFSYLIYKQLIIKTPKLEYNPYDRNYLFVKYDSENTVTQLNEFIQSYFNTRY
jgi:FkbM family methyltransferase